MKNTNGTCKLGRLRKRVEHYKGSAQPVWCIEFPGVWPSEAYTTREAARKALEEYRVEHDRKLNLEEENGTSLLKRLDIRK